MEVTDQYSKVFALGHLELCEWPPLVVLPAKLQAALWLLIQVSTLWLQGQMDRQLLDPS